MLFFSLVLDIFNMNNALFIGLARRLATMRRPWRRRSGVPSMVQWSQRPREQDFCAVGADVEHNEYGDREDIWAGIVR